MLWHCPAGNGVVVHHSDTLGLVVVDRNTVAVGAGDVRLTFGAAPAEADAAIRFLHPLHNFALLSYDPAALPPEARCPAPGCARHMCASMQAAQLPHVGHSVPLTELRSGWQPVCEEHVHVGLPAYLSS